MKRKAMPWVIPEYCEGCTSCIAACKKGCLQMFATKEEEVFIPWIDNPESCIGCGLCSDACAMGGIAMTEYQEEAIERFHRFILTELVHRV